MCLHLVGDECVKEKKDGDGEEEGGVEGQLAGCEHVNRG